MDNKDEIFPIVDEGGTVLGSATRGECHGGSMLLHPVVHLHVFNSRGEIYLQRRPAWKDIQPGKWDTAVGGHIDYGETPEEALMREVREELGIEAFTPEVVDKYVLRASVRGSWCMFTVPPTMERYTLPPTNLTAGASGLCPKCVTQWARVC